MISLEKLKKFAPKGKSLEQHAVALEAARLNSTVNTTRRLAHFLGQIYVETGGFVFMVENLNYRDPTRLDAIFSKVVGLEDAKALIKKGPEAIANRVYAGRLGNGDEASGDGWRYRGGGHKQITGRANYREIGDLINLPLEQNPEMARDINSSAKIAFAFWDARDCSFLADAGDAEGITAKINGPAKLGLVERRDATFRALNIFK